MSKFQTLERFETSLNAGYRLLPFRFTQLSGDEYVLSNLAGEFVVLERSALDNFAQNRLGRQDPAYFELI